jgi:hypothetical protein
MSGKVQNMRYGLDSGIKAIEGSRGLTFIRPRAVVARVNSFTVHTSSHVKAVHLATNF